MKNNKKCTLLCLLSVFCWLLWHCGQTIPAAPSKEFFFQLHVPRVPNFLSVVLSRISTSCKVHVTQTHNSCCYRKAINVSLILFLFLYHLLPCYVCRCAECLQCLCHLFIVSFSDIYSKEVGLSSSCIILFMEN